MQGRLARYLVTGVAVIAAYAALAWSSASAQGTGAAEPYEWKKFSIIIGSTPSGGFDTYGRLLARHIGKYLPGHPTVIVSNRPGAGGMIGYNYIYNLAPKDGTEIGISAPGNMIDRLLTGDKSNARYEPEKFGWLGIMDRETAVFIMSRSKSITLKDILAGATADIGMSGAGGNSGVYGRALKDMLGLKYRLVSGYPGMAQVLLAFEAGEVDGVPAANWDSLKATKGHWFTSGKADVILQYGAKRHRELQDVPTVHDILTRDDDRQAMNVFTTLEMMSRPVFAPPDLPPERLAALRRAFDATMRDPELVEEAKKMGLGIDWAPGSELDVLVKQIVNPSAAAVKKIRELAGN